LTAAGTMLGTPDYLAPEQARDAHAVGIRADIYSLGCVLYHALTGQPPFPDTSPIRQLVRHATETPLPLRTLNPDVPQTLQPILDKMLAKDPDQRYATPQQAAAAMRAFLTAKDVRGRAKDSARLGAGGKTLPTSGQLRAEGAAGRSPAAPAGRPKPASVPVLSPRVAVPVLAVPVPTSQSSAPPIAADVELVTAAVVEEAPTSSLTGGWTRREWLIFTFGMAVGGGAVLALGGLGFLGAKLLRPKARDAESPGPTGAEGAGTP